MRASRLEPPVASRFRGQREKPHPLVVVRDAKELTDSRSDPTELLHAVSNWLALEAVSIILCDSPALRLTPLPSALLYRALPKALQ